MRSDPEWKYVSLRRYFAYLKQSIDKGTQWVVFEPNGEQLWIPGPANDREVPARRIQKGQVRRSETGRSIFRPVRSFHHNPERHR